MRGSGFAACTQISVSALAERAAHPTLSRGRGFRKATRLDLDLSTRADPRRTAGGDEVAPDCVVVFDDLRGTQVRTVRRRVAVARHGRAIAARERRTHGGVDAIVGGA